MCGSLVPRSPTVSMLPCFHAVHAGHAHLHAGPQVLDKCGNLGVVHWRAGAVSLVAPVLDAGGVEPVEAVVAVKPGGLAGWVEARGRVEGPLIHPASQARPT